MTAPFKILKEHGFYAKKELGQNFLIDPSSPEMILRKASLKKDSVLVEIGPGLGALTFAGAVIAKKVYAVEKDSRLIPLLEEERDKLGLSNVEFINNDILKTDIAPFLSDSMPNYLIGNLPYNISSQIIFIAVDNKEKIEKCVFMLQKELCDRILSNPGSKEYGRISVVLQYHADIKKIANLGPNLFYPKPKVDSSVIEIEFKQDIKNKAQDISLFNEIIKAAFGQRRKTIRNSLGKIIKDKEILSEIFNLAGIDGSIRPENLSVDDFVSLSNIISSKK